MSNPVWLSPAEFRTRYGLTEATYFRMKREGRLPPYIRLGARTIRSDPETADHFFAQHAREGPSPHPLSERIAHATRGRRHGR